MEIHCWQPLTALAEFPPSAGTRVQNLHFAYIMILLLVFQTTAHAGQLKIEIQPVPWQGQCYLWKSLWYLLHLCDFLGLVGVRFGFQLLNSPLGFHGWICRKGYSLHSALCVFASSTKHKVTWLRKPLLTSWWFFSPAHQNFYKCFTEEIWDLFVCCGHHYVKWKYKRKGFFYVRCLIPSKVKQRHF